MAAEWQPLRLTEFGQSACSALEVVEERDDPEPLTTLLSSGSSFLSFSYWKAHRPDSVAPSRAPPSSSHLPESFLSFPQDNRMLHQPVPMHPIDALSHLDLTQTCIPIPPSTPVSPSSRPRARQVLNKIKRQASAFVKSPSKNRLRSQSCTQATPPKRAEEPPVPIPRVTFVSAASVHSVSSVRARSVSCCEDDARSVVTSILHIDAPSGGDFVPYLPLAVQLERRNTNASRASRTSRNALPSTPPPLPDGHFKRPVIPPSSPSRSERSDSTSSTRSPVTPVFPHHPFASTSALSQQRWSACSDELEGSQNDDPFIKGKGRVVRRSLIKDDFLLACAAVDDSPVSLSDDNGTTPQSLKTRRSSVRKKSAVSLPPSKPPPSCPLPSPPSITSEDSDAALSPVEKSDCGVPAAGEEWTLFLGTPSKPLKPLQLRPVMDLPRKESMRGRSGSSPSAPSSKQHLSPTDIPAQVKQELQTRVRTISNLSTRSTATMRRIESGPADSRGSFEDWTLSLPLLKKPKSSLCINTSDLARVQGGVAEAKTRKCKSFAEWTTSLSDEYEREERRLRELEREREKERERKLSRVSIRSVSSSASKSSQHSVKVKRQLPIGPVSSSPVHPQAVATGNTIPSILNPAASRSTSSLCSSAASFRSTSTSKSYKDNSLSRNPISATGSLISASAATSTLTLPATMYSVQTSTSVSTLGKFPLPPSFSSELLQRRQAAPPMPKPLLPACSFRSASSSLSPSSSLAASVRSHSSGLTTHVMYPSNDAIITSAPPTTSCFPTSPPVSMRKRPETYYYVPPSTTSSTASSASSVSTRGSIRTISSASTIVPARARAQRLGELDRGPSTTVERPVEEGDDVVDSSSRGSFESSIRDTEYDTCTEGGFFDATETESTVSDAYYSARSSLSL